MPLISVCSVLHFRYTEEAPQTGEKCRKINGFQGSLLLLSRHYIMASGDLWQAKILEGKKSI